MLFNEQAKKSAQLKKLIDLGVIDTVFDPFAGQFWPPRYFDWFTKLKDLPRYRKDAQTFDVWPDAKTTRWQEHSFTTIDHHFPAQYWAVELARFPVPTGSIGFVKWVEQVVNDVDGNYYPTNVFYWGSPQFVLADVDNLRWYLRLTMFDGTQPARYQVFNAAAIPSHALPGVPYSDLPVIDALWYPAHAKKDLKLIVPGGWQLRFFLISPPTTTYQWQVSGKLSGYIQSTFQNAAVINAREL